MLSKSTVTSLNALKQSAPQQAKIAGALTDIPHRDYKQQRLHFYDKGAKQSISGVKCTLFGGSGTLGVIMGTSLTSVGSQCIYPYRNMASIFDYRFRDLKTVADLGYKLSLKLNDFTDEREIDLALKDSNVVINAIGSRRFYRKDKDFEEANIRIPMAIAKAAKKRGSDIQRFIHISAAGADPNSPSRRLRTKWIGEQEVRSIYPDAIILRPTYFFSNLHPNASMAGKWMMQMKMFNRMNFIIDGAQAQIQPVHIHDIVLALMNILKMEETRGNTYDLGGPHVYNINEIYELFFNMTNLKPYSAAVKLEDAFGLYHSRWYHSFWRIIFSKMLAPEMILEDTVDLVCNPNNKGFEDLFIKPISFGSKVQEYVQDIMWFNNSNDMTKRESANA